MRNNHVAHTDKLEVPNLELGIYRHYKGNLYEVISVALHSETLEPLVIYKPLYETNVPFWVRPYELFIDNVEVDGKIMPHFEKVN